LILLVFLVTPRKCQAGSVKKRKTTAKKKGTTTASTPKDLTGGRGNPTTQSSKVRKNCDRKRGISRKQGLLSSLGKKSIKKTHRRVLKDIMRGKAVSHGVKTSSAQDAKRPPQPPTRKGTGIQKIIQSRKLVTPRPDFKEEKYVTPPQKCAKEEKGRREKLLQNRRGKKVFSRFWTRWDEQKWGTKKTHKREQKNHGFRRKSGGGLFKKNSKTARGTGQRYYT